MSKYKPETVNKIIQYISEGMTNIRAAKLAGICEDTFYSWRHEHPEFSELVEKANVEREHALLQRILQAGENPKSWQANAWYLERRYPETYMKKIKADHTLKADESFKEAMIGSDKNAKSVLYAVSTFLNYLEKEAEKDEPIELPTDIRDAEIVEE
jgi:hypothetical protein